MQIDSAPIPGAVASLSCWSNVLDYSTGVARTQEGDSAETGEVLTDGDQNNPLTLVAFGFAMSCRVRRRVDRVVSSGRTCVAECGR